MANQTILAEKFHAIQPSDFTLGEGLLKQRYYRNRARILSLPNSSLLKRYRERAALPAPGEYLSAWDEGNGICGAGGEFLGHWLSAAALVCLWDHDMEMEKKLRVVIDELILCADPDGYVSTAVEEDFQRFTHNFYRFDKLLNGLIDSFIFTSDARVLQLATGTANRFQKYLNTLTPQQIAEKLTDVWKDEAYGAVENLVRLFEITGNLDYLDFARKLEIHPLLDQLTAGRDVITKLHSYSHNLLFNGYIRMYEATQDAQYIRAAFNAWEYIEHRTYVTGGSGDGCTPKDYGGEAWREPDEIPLNHQTQETCESYAWMKHSAYLLQHTGDGKYADMLERTLYNQILPSQGPGRGDWAYWLSLQDYSRMIFGYCWNKPDFMLDDKLCGQYYCCDGTGTRALVEFLSWVVFSNNEGLLVNLYTSANFWWREGTTPICIKMATDYPWTDEIHFKVDVHAPARMKLMLRIPGWVNQPVSLIINDEKVNDLVVQSGYAVLDRVWQDGDQVTLKLPMSIQHESLKSDGHLQALVYGPLVLAGLQSPEEALVFPKQLVRIADEPLTFLAVNERVQFRPICTVSHEPYTIYFRT